MFRKSPNLATRLGAIVLGGILLWGCGGGGGGGASTGTGGTTNGGGTAGGGTVAAGTGPSGSTAGDTPMSATSITAVMNAADTQFSGIVNSTTDHDVRNQKMVAWLKTRSEFAASGITPNVDCVWGRLKNGHLYVATSSFIPGEGRAATGRSAVPTFGPSLPTTSSPDSGRAASISPRRAATRAANPDTQLPKVAQARVLISLDPGFYNAPDNQIADMLRDRKYNVIHQAATVENLKNVQGDGAFWWGTHGGAAVDRNNKAYWVAGTATDVTDANNDTYKTDLDSGALTYFTAAYQQTPDGQNTILRTRYAITYKFIAKYNWSFAPQSFVFIDCCYSDSYSIVIDIANRGGPVNTTYGWSNTVLVSAAWKAGAFVFDRLLGANQVQPLESVPQRPFDAKEVYFEMKERGLDVGGTDCKLISRTTSGGAPALTPSISYMEMSERIQESPLLGKAKLTLHGIFGVDKGTVKIGGVEVPIDSWAPDKIECEPADLPGAGFAGDVQVLALDRPSNTVPLTQWHGTLTYDIDILPSVVSTAHSNITCDVYFRGDVHQYRELAGRAPIDPKLFNFRASQGSTAHWKVTGDPVPHAAWSEPISADLPFGLNGTVAPPYGTGYIVSGVMDAGSETVKFSFNYLGCVTGYNFPAPLILSNRRRPCTILC